jgi:hypothetical protein
MDGRIVGLEGCGFFPAIDVHRLYIYLQHHALPSWFDLHIPLSSHHETILPHAPPSATINFISQRD